MSRGAIIAYGFQPFAPSSVYVYSPTLLHIKYYIIILWYYARFRSTVAVFTTFVINYWLSSRAVTAATSNGFVASTLCWILYNKILYYNTIKTRISQSQPPRCQFRTPNIIYVRFNSTNIHILAFIFNVSMFFFLLFFLSCLCLRYTWHLFKPFATRYI